MNLLRKQQAFPKSDTDEAAPGILPRKCGSVGIDARAVDTNRAQPTARHDRFRGERLGVTAVHH